MRATSDFLLRESLALLLDDPTPRNVVQSMGRAYAKDAAAALALESQSQTEDESESQGLAAVATTTDRVMMVGATYTSKQLVTLEDRNFSVDAFIPQTLIDKLRATIRYQSIRELQGNIIRIVKYHFATPAQCRALQPSQQRRGPRDGTKLWLFVEALVVIDPTKLEVNGLPDLTAHAAVAKQLSSLTPSALEQRLVLRQGLEAAAVSTAGVAAQITPSPAKRFDDHHPLLDEDCEIPEDQERELNAQEGWGDDELLGQPTDSQLIVENGPVAGSSDATSPDRRTRLVVQETVPQASSSVLSQEPAERDASAPDSQEAHFQQVNLKKAFVDCSDTDSDDDRYDAAEAASPLGQRHQEAITNKPTTSSTPATNANTQASSQETESQSFPMLEEASKPPLTQAAESNNSLPLSGSGSQTRSSQAAGEFVGVVRAHHDEPMTQAGDASQAAVPISTSNREWHTQAPSAPSQSLEIPSDQETVDVEFDMGTHRVEEATTADDETQDDRELEDRLSASQQDGQADHWMHTQPLDGNPAQPPSDGGTNITQRRKRRHSNMAASSTSAPHSPQEPNAKAARVAVFPSTAVTSATSASSRGDSDHVASFLSSSGASGSSTALPLALGIAAFSRKATTPDLQRVRPSKRYQHLLPPLDMDEIRQMIIHKKE